MKRDINIKKFSPYDTDMLRNIMAMSEKDMTMVMLDKGDIEYFVDQHQSKKTFDMPKGKSMKAAERRKRTYHKQQQREKQYRDLGYPIESLSASERGKMHEGVGAFPETQHNCSMYNRNGCKGGMRGYRKQTSLSIMKALEEAEHDEQVMHESAQIEYDLSELDSCIGSCVVDAAIYENLLDEVLAEIEAAKDNLAQLQQQRERFLKSIEAAKVSEERLRNEVKKLKKELEDLNR